MNRIAPKSLGLGPLIGVVLAALLVGAAAGCAPEERPAPDRTVETVDGNGLSAFELEHGIGPFTEVVEITGPVDPELARQGKEIYQMNCEACHRMEQRFVGPPMGDVLERKSVTYILNQITNPEQMAREHPEGQRLVQEYMSIMPDQGITKDQARAIVEYLRSLD